MRSSPCVRSSGSPLECAIFHRVRRQLFIGCISFFLSLAASLPAGAADGYRDAMRRLVIELAAHAKGLNPRFAVITQNGNALFEGPVDTPLKAAYLAAIDGVAQESLRFGDPETGMRTAAATTAYLLPILQHLRAQGKTILTIDYCDRPTQISEIFAANGQEKFISFVAPTQALDGIPLYSRKRGFFSPLPVETLAQARNFLYLINPETYSAKADFIGALRQQDFDLLVIDADFGDGSLGVADLKELAHKKNGARRLVFAYLSIGEAENYRSYWRPEWNRLRPEWIESENPQWKGDFRVKYWDPAWKFILFGRAASYLDRLVAAGFDGVYLDTVDTFYYFEDLSTRPPQAEQGK